MTKRRKRKYLSISYEDYIDWRPHFSEPGHETFEPCEIDPAALPDPVKEHYEFQERDVFAVMAYPGPKRQIFGKYIRPLVYLIVTTTDDVKEYWAQLPDPALRGEPNYWQRDKTIKPYKPWQW